ncbi:MAG: hypothetical protein H7201_17430 [Candidatus Saccharibacteria bacterium]|nr:hypothetical protein [Microbacteriaceae bacterium]
MTASTAHSDTAEPAAVVLIVLDVDGVLNRLPANQDEPAVPVTRRDGRSFPIRVDRAVIAALDEQVQRPGVRLGWLTTWGEDLDRLVIDAFNEMLSGGYVIAERPDEIFVPMDRKLRALLVHLEELGNPPYVWADDDAVNAALLFRPTFAIDTAGKRLLFDTDPEAGLTLEQVAAIETFIDLALSS